MEEAKQAQMSDYETKMQELLSNLHNMEKDMDERYHPYTEEMSGKTKYRVYPGVVIADGTSCQ